MFTLLHLQMALLKDSVMMIFDVKIQILSVQTTSVGVLLGTQLSVEFVLKVATSRQHIAVFQENKLNVICNCFCTVCLM